MLVVLAASLAQGPAFSPSWSVPGTPNRPLPRIPGAPGRHAVGMPASAAPDSVLRDALDRARAENAALQDRIRALEESVRTLKRSVFLLATDPARADQQAKYPLPSEVAAAIGAGAGADAGAPRPGAPADLPANPASAAVSVASGPPKMSSVLELVSNAAASGANVGNVGIGSGSASTVDASLGGLLPRGAGQTGRSDSHSTGSKFSPFVERVGLRGHSGAVYALRFSPDGVSLVSASFDRSVRVWRMDTHMSSENAKPALTIPDAHRAPVVAVEWLHHTGGHRLVTGGFDASAAEWDVDAALTTPITRVHTRGLVNAVSVSLGQPHVFFTATARNAVHMFDRRAPTRQNGGMSSHPPLSESSPSAPTNSSNAPMSAAARGMYDESTIIVDNDVAVNSIHVEIDGLRILTGDHGGAIKTWDLRMVTSRAQAAAGCAVFKSKPAALVDTTYNDPEHRPITHVHTAPPIVGDDAFGRWLAVNSYGSFLRVYDRGAFQMGRTNSATLKPIHALRGVINRNWPIKSSFFVGPDYRPSRSRRTRPSPSQRLRGHASLARAPSAKLVGRNSAGPTGSDTIGGGGSSENGGHSPALAMPSMASDVLDGPTMHGQGVQGPTVESSSDEGDSDGGRSGGFHSSSSSDDDDEHIVQRGVAPFRTKGEVYRPGQMAVHSAAMLASGSADGSIYIFDVGGDAGTGSLVQVLRGHRDRVNSVEFHPVEPILASASADSVVKIWS